MMQAFPKVLVVAPAWVGDMVIAQSLLQVLQRRTPSPRIDVLAPSGVHALLERMPEVNRVIELPIKHGELRLMTRYHLASMLSKEGYEQAIVLPNSFKSALIPFWARIPRRTGWLGEMRWWILNDVRILDKKKYPSLSERFTALAFDSEKNELSQPPYPSLQTLQKKTIRALERLNLIYGTKPILALCPGALYGPAKRWPARYFAEIAKEWLRLGWDIWILGSQEDVSIGNEICREVQQPLVDLTGKTSLVEAVDLLSLVTAVVTNDSGLMHIAAALNRPLVAIFGSSDPTYTPPLGSCTQVVSLKLKCSPCFQRTCPLGHLHCLNQLSPREVQSALEKVLMQVKSPPSPLWKMGEIKVGSPLEEGEIKIGSLI